MTAKITELKQFQVCSKGFKVAHTVLERVTFYDPSGLRQESRALGATSLK